VGFSRPKQADICPDKFVNQFATIEKQLKGKVMKLYDWYRNTIRNPKYRWWIILGTLTYLLSPIDIAPDFLPIIGQIDDAVIVTLLVSELSQMLIDRVKVSKNNSAAGQSPTSTETDSVDVNAVSVE
jgi:uncharacterized membrane protein YkvA (DUF1232 family)